MQRRKHVSKKKQSRLNEYITNRKRSVNVFAMKRKLKSCDLR